MNELTKWFNAVTVKLIMLDPSTFVGVDVPEARQQIEDLAALVTQVDPPAFTVRDTKGSSGQTDGN